MALGFARRGHTVAGWDTRRGRRRRVGAIHGPPHTFDVVDVANDGEVKAWADAFLSRCGPPDLLINNQALINANAPLWEVPAGEFARVIDVNLKGVVNVIRHVLPSIIARGSAVVVNLSSGWGRTTSPDVAPYCATKWGIKGLTRTLAQDLPKGLAAVPLNPGIIDTDMLRSSFGPSASRFLTPDAWSEDAVPFLLSLGPQHNGKPLTVPGQ